MLTEEAVLRRLRKFVSAFPARPKPGRWPSHFSNCKKDFAVLEEYKGELGICFKVGELLQGVFLKDVRFFRTPYIGKHGWVTLRVHAAPLDWKEVGELAKGSYQLVEPKALGSMSAPWF